MICFKNNETGIIATVSLAQHSIIINDQAVTSYPAPLLDYEPYHFEAAAAELGAGWSFGALISGTHHAFSGGSTLPAHDRTRFHYEEGQPTLSGGVATRTLVLRSNSNAEITAAQQAEQAAAQWDAFEAAVISAPLMNQMIASAFTTVPAACVGLGTTIARARDTGSTGPLLTALGAIIAASDVEPADLAAFIGTLAAFNLPASFTQSLAAAIAP